MNRRQLLEVSALAASGLLLGIGAQGAEAIPPAPAGAGELGDFLRITPDGEVSFRLVKHEMGQGVATALSQILCEELCADWNKLHVEFSIADLARFENERNRGHGTGGSATIMALYDRLRQAGAAAREMLVTAAAHSWGVPAEQCRAQDHRVHHPRSGRTLSFGELAAAAARLPVPEKVRLKQDRAFTVIGQPKPGKLVPAIATGRLKYGIDVQLPGMRYAVIARCPVFKGSVARFDAVAALKIAGVKHVFGTEPIAGLRSAGFPHHIRDGVAVVADSFWAAQRGRKALKIDWNEGQNARFGSDDFERWAAERAAARTDPTGYVGAENAIADMAHVRKTLRASYVYPPQLHSCMEPLNCTVWARADRCEVWCGSQAPELIVAELAQLLGLPQRAIVVHLMPSGGGFGRRYYPDFAVEAAFVSRQAGGVPVKLLWTREDDQRSNMAHPHQQLEYQAALDESGALYAWYEKEVRSYTWGGGDADPRLPPMAYDIPNIRYDFEPLIERSLIQSCAWRGVMFHGQALSECFIDEIAAAAKVDPLEFRLSLLKPGRVVEVGGYFPLSSDRLRAVLRLAADKANWGRALGPGQGRGIALFPYGNTCCAAVAEVSVREAKLRVDRMTLAVDCGKVINPSGAKNQLAGGLIWSLTALLYGGVPIDKGRAVRSNFHENKLLRMDECPVIDVHLVPSGDTRPWGIGEVSAPLGVPAVLNAIHAATGQRIRRIPLAANAFAPATG